jgi:1-acyl-sn-glycerol-3-phosphate acyltransferase
MDFYDFVYLYIFRFFFFIVFSFFKIGSAGKENLPTSGGFILAANHSNFLDGPFIAYSVRPLPVHWLVHKNIYNSWYFRPFCTISKGIPVNGAVEPALNALNKGGVIGIFPQGGICCDKLVQKGRRGAALLAMKTGVPVVPCYIDADIDFNHRINLTPKLFTSLTLIIGKPIYFEKCAEGQEIIPKEILEEAMVKIISNINSLSPHAAK